MTKCWNLLSVAGLLWLFGGSLGVYEFIFDTPLGELLKQDHERRIEEQWQKSSSERTDVIIDVPSLGDGVTMLGSKSISTGYLSFRGIKYAEAERFEIPKENGPYPSNIQYDATSYGKTCPQSSNPNPGQDEHCQYLNIYMPDMPENLDPKLPVMVFIHGGAFVFGSGNGYEPDFLIRHGVIQVTINYRLGALGFFTTNTDEAPGNYGLYDQREALRWVRDHIGDFGGNSSCMTVFGESAGSVSASYMTIVADEDTIHRAISESGTTSEVWSLDYGWEYAAEYMAVQVDCFINITGSINMTCMREIDQFALTKAELDLVTEDRKNGLMGFRGCTPTIQDESLKDAILTKTAEQYYIDEEFRDIPYMMGTNKDEGALITLITQFSFLYPNRLFHNEEYLREEMVNDILLSFGSDDPSHAIANTMYQEYCAGVDLGHFYDAAFCLKDMWGAMFLKAGGWKVANMRSYLGNESVFFYSMDYNNPLGELIDQFLPYEIGVMHGEELQYIFGSGTFRSNTSQAVSDRMSLMWTNMAKFGDPTPTEVQDEWKGLDIPKFMPYRFEDHHYMLFREEFIMQTEFTDRWTINYDQEFAGHDVTNEPPLTSVAPADVEDSQPEVAYQDPRPPAIPSMKTQSDVDDMEDKGNAYMITMIVFIVTFCIEVCVACFYFYKWKKG